MGMEEGRGEKGEGRGREITGRVRVLGPIFTLSQGI